MIVIGKDVEESRPAFTYLRYPSQRLEGLKETVEHIIDSCQVVRPDFN
jgi:hypothetical protein